KFTLFAPTDMAFGRLPERVLTGWQNNPDALRKVLLHHLIRGEFLTENLTVGSSLVMADGQELLIGDSGAGIMLAGVPLQTQIEAKNGVIHELDRVILPTSDFAPTLIDSSGVATFKGTELVIVGSAEVGATILVELNGESYGEAVVDAAGFWRVAGIVEEGEYEILAYALNEKAVLQNISPAVLLLVQE
ncbi:MAG TPA: fasciclin domain-containing protein, partial [Anaerolineae bacterium]|nr:fasciclin domain-containing protein [Anaerolineae bacterium]